MRPPKYQKDIESFLSKAKDELGYIRWDLKGKLYVAVCFWAQQVAEKAMKALWAFHGKKPIKIHSLKVLAQGIEEEEPGIKKFKEKFKFLDKFYIATRYANNHLLERDLRKNDGLKAHQYAKEIFDFVKKKVEALV